VDCGAGSTSPARPGPARPPQAHLLHSDVELRGAAEAVQQQQQLQQLLAAVGRPELPRLEAVQARQLQLQQRQPPLPLQVTASLCACGSSRRHVVGQPERAVCARVRGVGLCV
jgi:hypothetical protein